jgi:hypothetical protein
MIWNLKRTTNCTAKLVAKKLYYDKIIVNSKNKVKTTWNIIKSEKGRKYAFTQQKVQNICTINIFVLAGLL